MKLIVSATTDTLDMLLDKAIDGVIFPVRGHAMRYGETFEANQIEGYVKRAHAKGKKAYLSMNAIHHEPELASLESTFESLSGIPFDALYFADLAVYEVAGDYGLVHKLIYYPETYVTSTLDMRFWEEQSVKSAVLSREMTLEDIKVISQESQIGVSIIGHGYLNMFHSKRRLIKTFLNHVKRHDAQDTFNKPYTIIEEIREEEYPIYQDEFGTHIFREKPLSSMDVFATLAPLVSDFIIDTQFYTPGRIETIVDDYIRLQNGESVDETKYADHDDGFYFKKTVYRQGGGEAR